MEEPVLSILVLTYRNGRDIREALLSALLQDLSLPFEVILGMSPSGDGTEEEVGRVQEEHPELKVIAFPERAAQARARILALQEAKGKYVLFLDGDDALEKDAGRRLLAPVLEGRAEASACGYSRYVGGKVRPSLLLPHGILKGERIMGALFRDFSVRSFLWGKLLPRELLLSTPVYHFGTVGDLFEDVASTGTYLARLVSLALVPRPLVRYRLRPGSSTETPRKDRSLWHVRALMALRLSLEKMGREDLVSLFLRYRWRHALSLSYDLRRDRRAGASEEELRRAEDLFGILMEKEPLLGRDLGEALFLESRYMEDPRSLR